MYRERKNDNLVHAQNNQRTTDYIRWTSILVILENWKSIEDLYQKKDDLRILYTQQLMNVLYMLRRGAKFFALLRIELYYIQPLSASTSTTKIFQGTIIDNWFLKWQIQENSFQVTTENSYLHGIIEGQNILYHKFF